MKARSGLTLMELILAGAILATISFGAIVGMLRLGRIVNDRSQLMAADGYCWDVAWSLFNSDYAELRQLIDEEVTNEGYKACEIKGSVWHLDHPDPKNPDYCFLSHLQSPVCYVTFSNAVDRVTGETIPDGLCIAVNLEWGPAGHRSILMPRQGMDMSSFETVYDHPIEVFKSCISRSVK